MGFTRLDLSARIVNKGRHNMRGLVKSGSDVFNRDLILDGGDHLWLLIGVDDQV